jgi:1,4-alpha-glucan branching enzyme
MALHKMIRLVTSTLAGEGYLTFMGNEFGHPEWIDFPREGNGGSHKYARRQWSLVDDKNLKYGYLNAFDNAMTALLTDFPIFSSKPELLKIHEDDKLLIYKKGGLIFAFNFHTWKTAEIALPKKCGVILSADDEKFGGEGRIGSSVGQAFALPPRCAVVLKPEAGR